MGGKGSWSIAPWTFVELEDMWRKSQHSLSVANNPFPPYPNLAVPNTVSAPIFLPPRLESSALSHLAPRRCRNWRCPWQCHGHGQRLQPAQVGALPSACHPAPRNVQDRCHLLQVGKAIQESKIGRAVLELVLGTYTGFSPAIISPCPPWASCKACWVRMPLWASPWLTRLPPSHWVELDARAGPLLVRSRLLETAPVNHMLILRTSIGLQFRSAVAKHSRFFRPLSHLCRHVQGPEKNFCL